MTNKEYSTMFGIVETNVSHIKSLIQIVDDLHKMIDTLQQRIYILEDKQQ